LALKSRGPACASGGRPSDTSARAVATKTVTTAMLKLSSLLSTGLFIFHQNRRQSSESCHHRRANHLDHVRYHGGAHCFAERGQTVGLSAGNVRRQRANTESANPTSVAVQRHLDLVQHRQGSALIGKPNDGDNETLALTPTLRNQLYGRTGSSSVRVEFELEYFGMMCCVGGKGERKHRGASANLEELPTVGVKDSGFPCHSDSVTFFLPSPSERSQHTTAARMHPRATRRAQIESQPACNTGAYQGTINT
jgi:hypothetical protein